MRVLVLILCACGRIGFEPPQDATTIGCDAPIGADTVALYTFEEDLAIEATNRHGGQVRNGANVSISGGRCGERAARFAPNGYILVQDSPAFDLPTGSIELYIRTPIPTSPGNQTFFARDAGDTVMPGHLQLFLNQQADLIGRLQHGVSHYRCAGPVPSDRWVHVGISFGGDTTQGFQMWVDGVAAVRPTSMIDGMPIDCTTADGLGTSGNDNALVMGGSNGLAPEGSPDPNIINFLTGEIDHVHLRSTWRDFATR